MSWRDLLQKADERASLPWVGGRILRAGPRAWTIEGALPPEHGWSTFAVHGRTAHVLEPALPDHAAFTETHPGYLCGDRLVPDDVRPGTDPLEYARVWPQVHLLEPLERFERIVAGRTFEGGPLVFIHQAFPLGPEDAVRHAFQDKQTALTNIKGVTPALQAAFELAVWQRAEVERRRQQLARLRAEEEARRTAEERRQALAQQLGTGHGRREMARLDFGEAARAALTVGGAEYLDHRPSTRRGEFVVDYKVGGRRLQCVTDGALAVIDAGVCLTDHRTGIKGDTLFTLESLPAVILQAIREHKLVVYRHAGGHDDHDPDQEDD